MAQAQGLLNRPSLNYVQAWALSYFIEMDRRVQLEDKHAELEIQTFNLFPERWGDLYREKTFGGGTAAPGDMGSAFGPGEKEIPVTDINDINDWYNNISAQRGISGEQLARHQDPISIFGYAEGEGRRV